MEKGIKIAGIISGSVIVLALIVIWTIFQFMPANTISVSGQSEVKVIPDLISINFNINAKGDSASEAKDAVNKIYNELVSNLIAAGISEDEIKTTGLNVQQDYDWINGKQVFKGYSANHYVVVELSTENSGKIGDVIDAGVNAEALLSYINFELSPETQKEKKSETVRLATEDARTKAEAMAEGSGQKLGKIVSISDSNWGYSPFPVFRSDSVVASEAGTMAKEATADINPSEQIVYGNVMVVWKIR